jgi:hypothetical protein
MRIKGEWFAERMEYLSEIQKKVESRIVESPMPKGFGMKVSETLEIPPGPELGVKVEEIRQIVLRGHAKGWNEALQLMR